MTAWDRERWRKLYLREPLEHRLMPMLCRGLRDYLIRLAEDDGRLVGPCADPTGTLLDAVGCKDFERTMALGFVERLLDDGFLVDRDGSLFIRNLPAAQGDEDLATDPEDELETEPPPPNETKEERRRRLARARSKKRRASRPKRDGQRDAVRTRSVTERDGSGPSPSPLASPLPLPASQNNQTEEGERARDAVRTRSVTERDAGSVTVTRDTMLASYSGADPEDLWAFERWQEAFGKTGAEFSGRRTLALTDRRRAGMTRQDVIDALAGAKADPWVSGTKDGQRHDSVACIFGDADRYEGFRDAGRVLRAVSKSSPARKPPDIERDYTPPAVGEIPPEVLTRMDPRRAPRKPPLSAEEQLAALRLVEETERSTASQLDGAEVANGG